MSLFCYWHFFTVIEMARLELEDYVILPYIKSWIIKSNRVITRTWSLFATRYPVRLQLTYDTTPSRGYMFWLFSRKSYESETLFIMIMNNMLHDSFNFTYIHYIITSNKCLKCCPWTSKHLEYHLSTPSFVVPNQLYNLPML